jgi:hypothetical protein
VSDRSIARDSGIPIKRSGFAPNSGQLALLIAGHLFGRVGGHPFQNAQTVHQIDALDMGLKQLAFPLQVDQLKPAVCRLDPGHVLHHSFPLAVIFNIDRS